MVGVQVRDVVPVRVHDGEEGHSLLADYFLLGPSPEDIWKVPILVTGNLEPDVIVFWDEKSSFYDTRLSINSQSELIFRITYNHNHEHKSN